jgi:hypothetical protein
VKTLKEYLLICVRVCDMQISPFVPPQECIPREYDMFACIHIWYWKMEVAFNIVSIQPYNYNRQHQMFFQHCKVSQGEVDVH